MNKYLQLAILIFVDLCLLGQAFKHIASTQFFVWVVAFAGLTYYIKTRFK